MENIYKQEIEKITIMLNRLNKFKQLLSEEQSLSEQLLRMQNIIKTAQNETNIEITDNYLL
jgi:hypothetical protein